MGFFVNLYFRFYFPIRSRPSSIELHMCGIAQGREVNPHKQQNYTLMV
jgi:hypothetical protein